MGVTVNTRNMNLDLIWQIDWPSNIDDPMVYAE